MPGGDVVRDLLRRAAECVPFSVTALIVSLSMLELVLRLRPPLGLPAPLLVEDMSSAAKTSRANTSRTLPLRVCTIHEPAPDRIF